MKTSRASQQFSAKKAFLNKFTLYSLGTALGTKEVAVRDLIAEFGPVREGFEERTGFAQIYRADETESGLDLALRAVEQSTTDWWREQVDAIVYVTSTGDLVAPGNAHLLHSKLGFGSSFLLLDINDACTGFVRALFVSQSLVATGAAKAVLIVLSDTYTKLYEPSNLKVSPLFADGASALIISKHELQGVPNDVVFRTWELLSSSFLSEGKNASELAISRIGNTDSLGELYMNGAGVFNFVLRNINGSVSSLLAGAEIALPEVDEWYVHQGSRAVVNAVEKVLEVPENGLFRAGDYGNVVGSSIPFQLFAERDQSHTGGIVGLLGFGVGLTMAGMLLRQIPHD